MPAPLKTKKRKSSESVRERDTDGLMDEGWSRSNPAMYGALWWGGYWSRT